MNDETITTIETPPAETAETAPATAPVPDAETVATEDVPAGAPEDLLLLQAEDTVTVVSLEARPFLDVPFEDYSVTEGLLLCLLLAVFFAALWKILKGGLSWLF